MYRKYRAWLKRQPKAIRLLLDIGPIVLVIIIIAVSHASGSSSGSSGNNNNNNSQYQSWYQQGYNDAQQANLVGSASDCQTYLSNAGSVQATNGGGVNGPGYSAGFLAACEGDR